MFESGVNTYISLLYVTIDLISVLKSFCLSSFPSNENYFKVLPFTINIVSL
jgi:hypothetical protein